MILIDGTPTAIVIHPVVELDFAHNAVGAKVDLPPHVRSSAIRVSQVHPAACVAVDAV
jgi:hypothetical protein